MTARPLPDGRIPVLLSAHEEDLIGQDAAAIGKYLERMADSEVPAVAFTLQRTRRVGRHRAVVRAADRTELAAGLRALADDDEHPLVARSSETTAPRAAFVFPGQGNQWSSMGAEAYRRLPAYRAEADRCAEAFAAAGLPSPLPYLLTDPGQDWLQIHIQGAQFTHAVSLTQVWRSCEVLPDITVGHSLGEVAAAYVAGTVALPDAVAVVAARASVVDRLPGRYGVAVLGVGVDDAERLIAETPGWLEVSVVNSASSSVVSGERDAVSAIVRLAEQNGIFVRELDVDFPAHTSTLESLRGTLGEMLPVSAFLEAPVEFIGSAHGGVVAPGTGFTDYWYQNLRNTVRFDRAVEAAVQRGAGAFVEMSAHPSLQYALAELIDDALIVGSGRRDEPVVDQLSANIATAAVANPGYRWADVVSLSDERPLREFPNAPMRAVHLWATPEPLPPGPGSALTVAFEKWEPRAAREPSPADQAPCGVAIIGPNGTDDPLAQRLTEAIAAHQGCDLIGRDEAEIAVVIAPALLDPDAMVAADELVEAGPLGYPRVVGTGCRRVWLVTACGERVNAKEPVVLPAQAALAAMHRSVGFEFPDRTFAHMDLPSRDIDAEVAYACVDALLGDDTEVALRDSGSGLGCYIRTLGECGEPVRERPLDVAALNNVVITGGSGGIGLQYARHCVEHGARRLVLLSRRGVDSGDLDRLTSGHRVEVHAPACDITDPDALSVAAAEHAGAGASLLIHAAGAARFDPHEKLTDADLADVFGAKVAGLARMTDVWPLRPDVRILLCSSVSGVWGGHGHAAYAASNRILDVFAAQLRAKGLDAMAVRWGLWQGTGVASADEITRIERSGLVAMDPDAAINTSLRHHDGDPLILAADFDRLRVFFESQGTPMPFTTVPDEPDETAGIDGSGERPVADVVRAELASALSLDGPASVDLSAALVDLGVDSLLAVDLRKRLRRDTGRSVPLAKLLGGITGTELIDAIEPGSSTEASATSEKSERLESSRD